MFNEPQSLSCWWFSCCTGVFKSYIVSSDNLVYFVVDKLFVECFDGMFVS